MRRRWVDVNVACFLGGSCELKTGRKRDPGWWGGQPDERQDGGRVRAVPGAVLFVYPSSCGSNHTRVLLGIRVRLASVLARVHTCLRVFPVVFGHAFVSRVLLSVKIPVLDLSNPYFQRMDVERRRNEARVSRHSFARTVVRRTTSMPFVGRLRNSNIEWTIHFWGYTGCASPSNSSSPRGTAVLAGRQPRCWMFLCCVCGCSRCRPHSCSLSANRKRAPTDAVPVWWRRTSCPAGSSRTTPRWGPVSRAVAPRECRARLAEARAARHERNQVHVVWAR